MDAAGPGAQRAGTGLARCAASSCAGSRRRMEHSRGRDGMTQAGGVEAPAEVMGTIALSELVLHGWDVARAIGIDYALPEEILQVVFDFHHPPGPQSERDGMFGPVVAVPDDARLIDRLAGLTGRDPFWPHGTLEE
ncbi:TIGR03086 family metal-binding protein [Gordonia aquimaris]|uniref:TIGR03086 family metal-binding protein n=1 Tax=Gordonia aquimaris TaxID=2984863 RepID=A0A9X3D215_9ACTN|nr:TIGR03086 family metal-binding protein [Gordonia aquimaris]MCX2963423.1 TIGR03086 family metal-binding protein [Gordonia aquimaris]